LPDHLLHEHIAPGIEDLPVKQTVLPAVCLLTALTLTAAPKPLVYLPCDQGITVAVGRLGAASVLPETTRVRTSGIRGESLRVEADLRLTSEDNFNTSEGTVAFWVRPAWKQQDAAGHHVLFCIYGGEQPTWARNRWSIWADLERVSATVYPDKGERGIRLETPWSIEEGTWHHVAWTWHNIGSNRPDAELILFLDGQPVARRSDLRIDVGTVGQLIDIGRDSDGTPDYADADYDEFYIYGVALSPETIAAAVKVQRKPVVRETDTSASSTPPAMWPDSDRTCRLSAQAELPAGPPGGVTVRIPFGVQDDLTQLGLHAAPMLETLVVRQQREAQPLSHGFSGTDLLVAATTDGRAQTRQFVAYFALQSYDFSRPLMARMRGVPAARAAPAPFVYADFAQTVYGDAWDFDEGDTEAIDQWGNAPWCLKNRRVEKGILKMDVSEDPWFVWGDIWKQTKNGPERPVAIDLGRFNLLEMRVRQSCSSAEWTVFGLPRGGGLKSHAFRVTGNSWQVVRLDLREEAGFHGTLEALRIDPTSHIKEAHIEIDWVRITRSAAATREALEVAPQSLVPPTHFSAIHFGSRAVLVGSPRTVTVMARDRGGSVVPHWPVRFTASGHGTRLEATAGLSSLAISGNSRRAITNANGVARVLVHCSPKAGEGTTVLSVSAEFASGAETRVVWDGQEGPPHHYRVSPRHPSVVRENDLPLEVTVQLVDVHDNPLAVKGRRVTPVLPDAMTAQPATASTDGRGMVRLAVNFDLTKRWVGQIGVEDEHGLAGSSAPISVALDTPLPFTYRLLPNGYFATTDGRPFVPLGGFYANWVQSETPDGEWSQCNPFHDTTEDQKRVWLAKLAERGVTSLRFMLRTHRRDPGIQGTEALDAGGRVNRRLFSEILRYMDLAREYGIVFLAVVHDDYYKPIYCDRKNYDLFTRPAFAGIDLDTLPPFQRRFVRDGELLKEVAWKYTDPDAMACQDLYVRELTSFLRNCPAVFAYELENEMVSCPASWANHAIAALREGDPARTVCASHGGGGMFTVDPLWWHEKTDIDFYTYHLYPHANRCTTPEIDYGLASDVLTRYGRMCGVSFFGESSGDQFRHDADRERRRRVMRDLIWFSLTNGNPGCFFWNARLSEVAEFAAAKEAMSRLDLLTFERAKPDVAVLVTHPLDDDKYYRNTEQGRKDYDLMARYCRHYHQLGVDVDFAMDATGYAQTAELTGFAPPKPRGRPLTTSRGLETTYLTRPDWSEALIYVRNVSGIEPVELKHGRGVSLQHLRTRKPLDWRLRLDLPTGDYTAHVYDLDLGTTRDQQVTGKGEITLGTTDHDVAVVLKRR
jgi:hypothetical protein